MKILHVITGLDVGGAETVLLRLLQHQDLREFDSEVVSLSRGGSLAGDVEHLGVPVHELGPSRNSPSGALRLRGMVLRFHPDVIQTWMYHANFFGGLAARLSTRAPVVWGIHSGPAPPKGFHGRRSLGMKALSRLSHRLPTKIICCSETSRSVHVAAGYPESKMVVVPNGFVDPGPVPVGDRESVLAELGLGSDVLLVGRIGRDHPQKDIGTLLDSFQRIGNPRVHLIIAGKGLTPENSDLLSRFPILSADRIHLLGPRTDIVALNAAFDVAVSSSSFGEALPLVLGEAMATATPVVSTDVGDAMQLIGDRDRVVPPRDPDALAKAIRNVLELPESIKVELGRRDRDRVLRHYSVERMTSMYEDVYREIMVAR